MVISTGTWAWRGSASASRLRPPARATNRRNGPESVVRPPTCGRQPSAEADLGRLPFGRVKSALNSAAKARAIVAPALDGFSPTPEMPEIEEAQALFKLLAMAAKGKPQR